MSKVNCNVINDMLPLYVDGILHDDSKTMVDEHIASCKKCQKAYEEMTAGIPKFEDQEIAPFKKIKRKHRIRVMVSVVITAVVAFALFMYCADTTVPIRAYGEQMINEDVSVVELDGKLYLQLTNLASTGYVMKQSMPEDPCVKLRLEEKVLDHYFRMGWHEATLLIPLSDITQNENPKIDKIVFVDRQGNDMVTVYEK